MIADALNVFEECIFITLLIWGFEDKKGKYLQPSLIIYTIFATIVLETIYVLSLPGALRYLINLVILAYILFTYRRGLKNALVVLLLSTGSALLIQLILLLPFAFFKNSIFYETYSGLFINACCILVSALIAHKGYLSIITKWVMEKRLDHVFISIVWIGSLIYVLSKYNYWEKLSLWDAVVFLFFMITLIFLVIRWQKTIGEVQSAKHELELQHLYGDTFQELIEEIRSKQHDYMDQLNTILSMHYQIKDYSTLVEEQSHFANNITENFKYYELLQLSNHILSGFLYSKFSLLETKGVPVDYKVLIENGEWEMHLFEVTEVVGILLNNAAEAALKVSNPQIKVHITTEQDGKQIDISVKNTTPNLTQHELQDWGRKGYTTKVEEKGLHGYGLYNVMRITKRNGGKLEILKDDSMTLTWIEINVTLFGNTKTKIR